MTFNVLAYDDNNGDTIVVDDTGIISIVNLDLEQCFITDAELVAEMVTGKWTKFHASQRVFDSLKEAVQGVSLQQPHAERIRQRMLITKIRKRIEEDAKSIFSTEAHNVNNDMLHKNIMSAVAYTMDNFKANSLVRDFAIEWNQDTMRVSMTLPLPISIELRFDKSIAGKESP
jgi:hypothetical protein